MFSRAFRTSIPEVRWAATTPIAARPTVQPLANMAAKRSLSTENQRSNSQMSETKIPPQSAAPATTFTPPQAQTSTTAGSSKLPAPPTLTTPLRLTPSLVETLPHLAAQGPNFYLSAHLHDRPYLLTAGDTLRLPFLMPAVQPGDVLRLNRASMLGSRDYTLKGSPYVDERLFECRVRVMGVESEPLRIKEKTKRRQRHVRRVKSKHKYTILRVMEVRIKNIDELLAQGVEIVKE